MGTAFGYITFVQLRGDVDLSTIGNRSCSITQWPRHVPEYSQHCLQAVQKLNADEAVRTHREWKDRLRLAMAQREILDIERVSSDKHCVFGEWLYSERNSCHFQDADFAQCVALHAAFHLEAAGLASLINAGRYLEADRMFALGTSYSEASQAFIISVRTLFASAPSQ